MPALAPASSWNRRTMKTTTALPHSCRWRSATWRSTTHTFSLQDCCCFSFHETCVRISGTSLPEQAPTWPRMWTDWAQLDGRAAGYA